MDMALKDLLLAADLSPDGVERLLSPFGFEQPHEIDRALQRMCPAPADRTALAEHIQVFLDAVARSADPEACLIHLERVAESFGQRSLLYRRLGSDPRWLENFCTVAGSGRALADVLVLNPGCLDILADDRQLAVPKTLDEMRLEAARASEAFDGPQARLDALRRMRRREYLRIGARELTGLGSFADVVHEISDLAEALVAETLAICHESQPFAGGEKPSDYAVIALGKLGARELNYSSDIDLALVWDVPEGPEVAPLTAFYQKLSLSLVEALSGLSGEGRMYRVDLRLRPYGKSGPIGSSVAQFLGYYDAWSESWERQALIKARTIAGAPCLCERLERFLSEFAFARPLDAVSVQEILAVKQRSEEHRAREGAMDRQVKHGWGGIRDVEFTVQLLQLMAGADHPEVRTRATLDTLGALVSIGVLSAREEAFLESAYLFLRQVEHRLQLVDELPMQHLPDDPVRLRRVAFTMGYRDEDGASATEGFLADYDATTRTVRQIHERLFRALAGGGAREQGDVSSQLARIIQHDDEDAGLLESFGFRFPADAAARLRQIARGSDASAISSERQRRFLQMLPDLLAALAKSPDPDAGLLNLQRIAEATGSPLQFFRSIGSGSEPLGVFAMLAASGEFLPGALARHPEYIDFLASPAAISRAPSLADLRRGLIERVRAEGSFEGRLDALRRFRLREFLRIGVRDVAGLSGVTATMRHVSLLAEACLFAALEIASGRLDGENRLPGHLAVLGMGKLGGRELHYSSDLDLVCVYEEAPGADGARRDFERAVREILDILGRLTAEGRGFKVDLRLRPEGSQGVLAVSFAGYCRYLEERVQAWERQALLRARVVAGDRALGRGLLGRVEETLWGRPFSDEDMEELRHIKRRIENERASQSGDLIDIKLGPGGILDIEFTVQALQMAYGASHRTVRTPNTLRAITGLKTAGALSPADATVLRRAYLFLRRAENRLQMASEQAAEGVPAAPEALATFAARLGYADRARASGQFLAGLGRHTARVRAIHEAVFYESDLTRDAWALPSGQKRRRRCRKTTQAECE
jgi:glutamate-ammonia-ligase adenylyltransferase